MRLLSLPGKVLLSSIAAATGGIVCFGVATTQKLPLSIATTLAIAITAIIAFVLSYMLTKRIQNRISALQTGLLNLADNDYSASINSRGHDELDTVIQLYNDLAQRLRHERQHLYQRELLLDTVIQNSELVLLLSDAQQRIVYCNSEARKLFGQTLSQLGAPLSKVLDNGPEALREMVARGQEGLVSFSHAQQPEVYHLSIGTFTLQMETHTLYLLKQLTRDITRKEIETWKKVIRVISHEINNSLAPISSMAHSGKQLLAQQKTEKLGEIFNTIHERSNHLSEFIEKYIHVARLPQPQKQAVAWQPLLARLKQHYAFQLTSGIPERPIMADAAQLEQALLNLLKNAHESGSAIEAICVEISVSNTIEINVLDRGKGLSAEAQENILLPLYTTKAGGSGIGLALCREIAEAHGGSLQVSNRSDGGVAARLRFAIE